MAERILEYIAKFLALIVVLPIHEFAHAFVAVKCGDPTPKMYGRYTINPLAHFDLLGLACFLFAGFGWAKPVPVNPYNFKHYKRGSFFVSVAGVVSNYLLAFLVFPLAYYFVWFLPEFGYFTLVLRDTLMYVVGFSLSFFVFNLIPVYPLDGFRALDVFVKRQNKFYIFLRTKGIYLLYALFALSLIADFTGLYYLDVFGNFMNTVVGFISKPIIWFWNLILQGVMI